MRSSLNFVIFCTLFGLITAFIGQSCSNQKALSESIHRPSKKVIKSATKPVVAKKDTIPAVTKQTEQKEQAQAQAKTAEVLNKSLKVISMVKDNNAQLNLNSDRIKQIFYTTNGIREMVPGLVNDVHLLTNSVKSLTSTAEEQNQIIKEKDAKIESLTAENRKNNKETSDKLDEFLLYVKIVGSVLFAGLGWLLYKYYWEIEPIVPIVKEIVKKLP